MTRYHSRFISTILTALAIVTAAAAVHARETVEIRVRGYYYAEPATVQVTVAVAPDETRNRTLRVEADGETMFRSSEVPISGDEDKKLYMMEFKNLQAGAYTLRAEVLAGKSVIAVAEQELLVAGH